MKQTVPPKLVHCVISKLEAELANSPFSNPNKKRIFLTFQLLTHFRKVPRNKRLGLFQPASGATFAVAAGSLQTVILHRCQEINSLGWGPISPFAFETKQQPATPQHTEQNPLPHQRYSRLEDSLKSTGLRYCCDISLVGSRELMLRRFSKWVF
jgi:hypothetical protein